MHRSPLLASLLAVVVSHAAAQSDAWQVGLVRTTGSLEESSARTVIVAARGALVACASPGAQSYSYELSLRTNGTVREAAYDRGAASDARGARCIRHALLELHFPAHDQATTFTLTLGSGDTTPTSAPSSAPPSSAPPPSAPSSALSPPPLTAAAPPPTAAPTPTPMPSAPSSAADVRIGPLASTPERSADLLRSVVAAQLGALSACLATGRASAPTLAGDATLYLTIAPDGRVTSVLFQAPEALASGLAACVGQAGRGWTFSAASAEERASIPLSFGVIRPERR